jgi:hypothetical protein
VHKTKDNFNSLAVRATSTRRSYLREVEHYPSLTHSCGWQLALERSTISRGICVSSAAIAGTISKEAQVPSLPSNVPKMLGRMNRANLVSGGGRTGSHSPLPSPIVLCPSSTRWQVEWLQKDCTYIQRPRGLRGVTSTSGGYSMF